MAVSSRLGVCTYIGSQGFIDFWYTEGPFLHLWSDSSESEKVQDACRALLSCLYAETRHTASINLEIWGTSGDLDLHVGCTRCRKSWSRSALLTSLTCKTGWGERWIRTNLIPLGVQVMETTCQSLTDRQIVYELVTTWLIHAGADGLPYSRVLGRLIMLDLGELDGTVDLAEVIKALDMEVWYAEGQAMLRLPEGHPDRNW